MITRLRVQNFRKHVDTEVVFTDSTVITGANGVGKTSLIEAIYIALQGKSWRSGFSDILGRDQQDNSEGWWRIDVDFLDGETRTVKYQDGQKSFEVNGVVSGRLPTKFKKPVVLFEPNDLQLLYGSPVRRREFFDRFITQIEPGYASVLHKFERVLRQRNSLLRKGTTKDEVFVWDVQFAELAEKIITLRTRWIKEINQNISAHYRDIASNSDTILLRYHAPHTTSQQILNQLTADLDAGWPYTKAGPQAHDVHFMVNGRDAKQTASRGENRTLLFAMLATMTEVLNKNLGQKAYLIFDDVDSELDAVHKGGLYSAKEFKNNYLYATTIKGSGRSINYLKLC